MSLLTQSEVVGTPTLDQDYCDYISDYISTRYSRSYTCIHVANLRISQFFLNFTIQFIEFDAFFVVADRVFPYLVTFFL